MPPRPGLPPLPPAPPDGWPDLTWDRAEPEGGPASLHRLVDAAFAPEAAEPLGTTQAILVVQRGQILAERYGAGIDATTAMRSWSIAKSVLNGLTGVMVRDGLVALNDPIERPEWSAADDPRRAISVDDALHMSTGLAWLEDYVDADRSSVIRMLYGDEQADMAGFTARQPLEHPPGRFFRYSSGTSNLLSAHLGAVLTAAGLELESYLRGELLGAIGITGARLKFDDAGTWIDSTYCGMTARDFARLGLLYLRDGEWAGRRVLPPGWVDGTREPQPDADDDGWGYGRHWWVHPELPGAFFASGYGGQRILVVPQADVVIVRLGESLDRAAAITGHLFELVGCLAPGLVGATAGEPDR